MNSRNLSLADCQDKFERLREAGEVRAEVAQNFFDGPICEPFRESSLRGIFCGDYSEAVSWVRQPLRKGLANAYPYPYPPRLTSLLESIL